MAAASDGKASDHFINPNNWEEVIDFAKALGVTAKSRIIGLVSLNNH